MNTPTKVFLAIVGIILLFLFFNWYKNRSKDDKQEDQEDPKDDGVDDQGTTDTPPSSGWEVPPNCDDLGPVGFKNLKKAKKNQVSDDISRGLYYLPDLYNKWKQQAILRGIGTDWNDVLEYASWGEAQEEMMEEGYCYYKV